MLAFCRILAVVGKTPKFVVALGLACVGLVFLTLSRPADAKPEGQAEKKANPSSPPTQYECRWADGPIKLDGKADEGAWKKAQVIDHFYLPWLGEDARSREPPPKRSCSGTANTSIFTPTWRTPTSTPT